MIRDEFIKQKNNNKLSPKQMAQMRTLGERGFYMKTLNTYVEFDKMMNFTSIFVGILLVLILVPMIIGIIAEGLTGKVLWMFIVFMLFVIAMVLWFTVFRPLNKKRIKKYADLLEGLRQKEVEKQNAIYKMINR